MEKNRENRAATGGTVAAGSDAPDGACGRHHFSAKPVSRQSPVGDAGIDRPFTFPGTRVCRVAVRLSPAERELIEGAATQNAVSLSAVVRMALAAWFFAAEGMER